jgi:hypothetical protein
LNRQLPDQPWPDGNVGSGGTAPMTGPVVWVHDVGAVSKSTLWKLLPLGKLKFTVPPAAIVISGSRCPVSASSKW